MDSTFLDKKETNITYNNWAFHRLMKILHHWTILYHKVFYEHFNYKAKSEYHMYWNIWLQVWITWHSLYILKRIVRCWVFWKVNLYYIHIHLVHDTVIKSSIFPFSELCTRIICLKYYWISLDFQTMDIFINLRNFHSIITWSIYLKMQTTLLTFQIILLIQEFTLTLKAMLNYYLGYFEDISITNMTKDDFNGIINQKQESIIKTCFIKCY